MFICDDCLKKNFVNQPSFMKSYGPCEWCKQRYIVGVHLISPECPFCDSHVSYFEAVADPEYKLGYGCENLRCPHCEKKLEQLVPFIGEWRWGKKEKNPDAVRRTP